MKSTNNKTAKRLVHLAVAASLLLGGGVTAYADGEPAAESPADDTSGTNDAAEENTGSETSDVIGGTDTSDSSADNNTDTNTGNNDTGVSACSETDDTGNTSGEAEAKTAEEITAENDETKEDNKLTEADNEEAAESNDETAEKDSDIIEANEAAGVQASEELEDELKTELNEITGSFTAEDPVKPDDDDTVEDYNATVGSDDEADTYNYAVSEYEEARAELNEDIETYNETVQANNAAVDAEVAEVTADTAANGQTVDANEAAIANNNNVLNMNETAPAEPELSITDDMTAEQKNEAIAEYNQDLADYNTALDNYETKLNEKVLETAKTNTTETTTANSKLMDNNTTAKAANDAAFAEAKVEELSELTAPTMSDITGMTEEEAAAAREAYNDQLEVYNNAVAAYAQAKGVDISEVTKLEAPTAPDTSTMTEEEAATATANYQNELAAYDAAYSVYTDTLAALVEPEKPTITDSMTYAEIEAAVNDYNAKVEAYNKAVNVYNGLLDEYEKAIIASKADEAEKTIATRDYAIDALLTMNDSIKVSDTDSGITAYVKLKMYNDNESGNTYSVTWNTWDGSESTGSVSGTAGELEKAFKDQEFTYISGTYSGDTARFNLSELCSKEMWCNVWFGAEAIEGLYNTLKTDVTSAESDMNSAYSTLTGLKASDYATPDEYENAVNEALETYNTKLADYKTAADNYDKFAYIVNGGTADGYGSLDNGEAGKTETTTYILAELVVDNSANSEEYAEFWVQKSGSVALEDSDSGYNRDNYVQIGEYEDYTVNNADLKKYIEKGYYTVDENGNITVNDGYTRVDVADSQNIISQNKYNQDVINLDNFVDENGNKLGSTLTEQLNAYYANVNKVIISKPTDEEVIKNVYGEDSDTYKSYKESLDAGTPSMAVLWYVVKDDKTGSNDGKIHVDGVIYYVDSGTVVNTALLQYLDADYSDVSISATQLQELQTLSTIDLSYASNLQPVTDLTATIEGKYATELTTLDEELTELDTLTELPKEEENKQDSDPEDEKKEDPDDEPTEDNDTENGDPDDDDEPDEDEPADNNEPTDNDDEPTEDDSTEEEEDPDEASPEDTPAKEADVYYIAMPDEKNEEADVYLIVTVNTPAAPAPKDVKTNNTDAADPNKVGSGVESLGYNAGATPKGAVASSGSGALPQTGAAWLQTVSMAATGLALSLGSVFAKGKGSRR